MFPNIVKKVFLKKIEKCKCYKRSSSDHQAIIERSSTSSGHNFGYRASILGPKKGKSSESKKEKIGHDKKVPLCSLSGSFLNTRTFEKS